MLKRFLYALLATLLIVQPAFAGSTFMSNKHPQPGYRTGWDAAYLKKIPPGSTYTSFQIGGDGTPGVHYSGTNWFMDGGYVIVSGNSDPTVHLYDPTDGSHRCPTAGTTTDHGLIHFPSALYGGTANPGAGNIPNWGNPNGGATTPNNPTIIYNPDTGVTVGVNLFARCAASGPIYGYIASKTPSTHGGSWTAGGEITSDEWAHGINHAIGWEIYGNKYLSPNDGGWKIPAYAADGYNENGSTPPGYNGSLAGLRIGSRLAIPTSYNCGGLSTTTGKVLCRALQDYGAILNDDPAWDAMQFAALDVDMTTGSTSVNSALTQFSNSTDASTINAQLQIVTFPTTTVKLTSGTSWTAPYDMDAAIQLWGAGAGGRSAGAGGGGGGGAYVKCNQHLTGGTAYTYAIGAGGAAGAAGGNTSWRSGQCFANGGSTTTTSTGGAGGTLTGSTAGDWGVVGGAGGNSATAGGSGGGSPDPEATNGTTATHGPTGNNAVTTTGGAATTGGKGNGSAGVNSGTAAAGGLPGGGGGARGAAGTSGAGGGGEIDISWEAPPVPGVLDAIPDTAIGAYSTRKLSVSYAGLALEVRRSSDSLTQGIGFKGNGSLDTDTLTAFCSGVNCFVDKWYDQSGNGFDATQATTAAQPKIVSTGTIQTVNSQAALVFDGTNSFMNISGGGAQLQNTGGATAIYTGNFSAGAIGQVVYEATKNGSNDPRLLVGQGSTPNFLVGVGRADADSPAFDGEGTPTAATHVLSFVQNYTSAQSSIWEDGANLSTNVSLGTSGSTANTTSSVYIGQDGYTGSRLNGSLCELLVFKSALASTSRKPIEYREGTYWGVTIP